MKTPSEIWEEQFLTSPNMFMNPGIILNQLQTVMDMWTRQFKQEVLIGKSNAELSDSIHIQERDGYKRQVEALQAELGRQQHTNRQLLEADGKAGIVIQEKDDFIEHQHWENTSLQNKLRDADRGLQERDSYKRQVEELQAIIKEEKYEQLEENGKLALKLTEAEHENRMRAETMVAQLKTIKELRNDLTMQRALVADMTTELNRMKANQEGAKNAGA